MAHASLQHTAHRPWNLPSSPWHWAQSWMDLAFIHWSVDSASMREQIPRSLKIDEHDGSAWLGVVPFHLRLRLRYTPAIPRVGIFPEINVRTYVTHEGKPGVWFFSLDARSFLAVLAARSLFALPYHRARMQIRRHHDEFLYESTRFDGRARFTGSYGPTGALFQAQPGSLPHFLTERYCLYAQDRRGRLCRSEIHHSPWPLQDGHASMACNTMLSAIGLDVPTGAPVVHFAKRIDAVVWPLRALK